MSLDLSNISIIVVEPKIPANVGSIARACQNLGIRNIILINPCDFHVNDAYRLAKNSKQLLFDIDVRATLQDCFEDHHVMVATTQRRRVKQVPFHPPSEMIKVISEPSHRGKVGIVFGREDHGLSNEELALCNFQSSIQAHADNPVFNLSQAVLIYAYECYNASSEIKTIYERPLATKSAENHLFEVLEETIDSFKVGTANGPKRLASRMKQVLGRIVFEERDIQLFHKFFELISDNGPSPKR
ncbi:MAG: tRNA/rRNA methyltransferase [Candidatus Marinamargulisbacteria bacterium]|jgi:tRNA/rRNA methyltransferase